MMARSALRQAARRTDALPVPVSSALPVRAPSAPMPSALPVYALQVARRGLRFRIPMLLALRARAQRPRMVLARQAGGAQLAQADAVLPTQANAARPRMLLALRAETALVLPTALDLPTTAALRARTLATALLMWALTRGPMPTSARSVAPLSRVLTI